VGFINGCGQDILEIGAEREQSVQLALVNGNDLIASTSTGSRDWENPGYKRSARWAKSTLAMK
jgi:hypothetical protein